MKPQLDNPMIGATFGVVGTILTIILILLFQPAKSQTIGVGLGKVSDGRTTAKMYFNTRSGWGAYVCHYADAKEYVEYCAPTGLQYSENPVTSLGITARIHSQVIVYAGAGAWHTCKAYNDEYGYRYYEKSKGKCIEAGATMILFKRPMYSVALDVSLNSTRQVNSMILISINPL